MKSGPDVFLSVCSTLEISSQSIPLDLLDRDSDFHVSMTLSLLFWVAEESLGAYFPSRNLWYCSVQ